MAKANRTNTNERGKNKWNEQMDRVNGSEISATNHVKSLRKSKTDARIEEIYKKRTKLINSSQESID